jgi:hypothetical protein
MTVAKGPPHSAPLALPITDYAMSDRTRSEVDKHAQELAHMGYARARQLMQQNRSCLDALANAALENETLTREDLDAIFESQQLQRGLVPDREVIEAAEPARRFVSPGAVLSEHSEGETPEPPKTEK